LAFPEPVPVEGLIVTQVALVHTVQGQLLSVPIDSEKTDAALDTAVDAGSVYVHWLVCQELVRDHASTEPSPVTRS
jgi:hypothetical protein